MYPLVPAEDETEEEKEAAVQDLKDKGWRAGVSRLLVRWEAKGLREETLDWDVFTVS